MVRDRSRLSDEPSEVIAPLDADNERQPRGSTADRDARGHVRFGLSPPLAWTPIRYASAVVALAHARCDPIDNKG